MNHRGTGTRRRRIERDGQRSVTPCLGGSVVTILCEAPCPGGEALMIKSMTGFASVTLEDDRAAVAVTIRSLNHRYLDLQLRIPQSLGAIESDVRALAARRVARGRLEGSLSLPGRQAPGGAGE